MQCRFGLVTSWSFPIFESMVIEGCSQILHMPHVDCDITAFNIGIIFKPNKGKLAFVLILKGILQSEVSMNCPVSNLIYSADSFQKDLSFMI